MTWRAIGLASSLILLATSYDAIQVKKREFSSRCIPRFESCHRRHTCFWARSLRIDLTRQAISARPYQQVAAMKAKQNVEFVFAHALEHAVEVGTDG
jgi:hypothetical protein